MTISSPLMNSVATVQIERTLPYLINRKATSRSTSVQEKPTRSLAYFLHPENWPTAVATLKAAITHTNCSRGPCINRSPANAAEDEILLISAKAVGKPYLCSPVKTARNAPKGNAKTVDNPITKMPSRKSPTRAGGVWWKSCGTRQVIIAMPTAPIIALTQRIAKELLSIWLPTVRPPSASYSATNLPIAVCKPRSSKLTYTLHCRISTHALYSAGAKRCTSKGGSTRATSIERTILAMLDAEPCRILRLCDIGGRRRRALQFPRWSGLPATAPRNWPR